MKEIQHLCRLRGVDLSFLQLLDDLFQLFCQFRLLEFFGFAKQRLALFQDGGLIRRQSKGRSCLKREPVVIPR